MSEDDELHMYEEDEEQDLELMEDIITSIKTLSENHPVENQCKKEKPVPNSVSLGDLSLIELQVMLDSVNQARDFNNKLQGMLLMKEVKLLSIKRQINSTNGSKRKKEARDDGKTDVGRYYARFKAPYFKSGGNFAGYVIVPERQLPFTAQRFEQKAIQWTKIRLKELEDNVRLHLSGAMLRKMMEQKPKNYKEKKKIINEYNYLRKAAPISYLLKKGEDVIDWCQVASRMKRDHTPNECQKAWRMFLRPEINKKKWSNNERDRLKKIILKYNYEDWDAIASELGTNRNGYQCFHHYVEKILRMREGGWSEEEEKFLIDLVKECSYGSKVLWHKAAYFFQTRTTVQIYRKWTLSSVGKSITSGNFTEEEDKFIMDMLLVNKEYSITQVAKKMNRISSQVRSRLSQLKFAMRHRYGEWTLEEDLQLMELVEKIGKKWAKIAEHLPSRSRVQIRHRYTNILKARAKRPNMALEKFSRPVRTVHMQRKRNNLKYALEVSGVGNEEVHNLKLGKQKDVDTSLGKLVLRQEEFDKPKKRKRKRLKKPKKPKVQPVDSKEETDGDEHVASGNDELLQCPSTSARRPEDEELCKSITDYFVFSTRYAGEPRKTVVSRTRDDLEAVLSLVNFTPYRHFDLKNAHWIHDVDQSDPYYREVVDIINGPLPKPGPTPKMTIPPCLTTFEAFYNLLVDVNFNEHDLDVTNDALELQMDRLYCKDDPENVAAAIKWNKRLASLFSWPAALSEIDVEYEDSLTKEPTVLSDDETINLDNIDVTTTETNEGVPTPENVKPDHDLLSETVQLQAVD